MIFKIRRVILYVFTLCSLSVGKIEAQEVITIEQCQQWARENYPLVKQFGLIEHSRRYNLSNANRNYLPQLSLEARASWQSEVIKIPLDIPAQLAVEVPSGVPGIGGTEIPVDIPKIKLPESSRDQYMATLRATQVLWDGGRIGAAKKVIEAETAVAVEGVEANLYALKGRVNDLYFGILLIDGRLEQLNYVDETLRRVRERVQTALENGVAYAADLDAVDVERLKYRQQRSELESRREAYLEMLSRFIRKPLDGSVRLQQPVEPDLGWTGDSISRPELRYLDRKRERLQADYTMMQAGNRPKLGLFVAGGYGKPGLNLLSDKFSPFFMGGIQVSWNFGSLYTLKNDKCIIRTKRENLDVEKASFLFNTRMLLVQNDADVKRVRKLIADDREIVRLRENIKKASEVKYENGVCTMAELIGDINAEAIARQEKLVREIECLMMMYERKTIKGEG